MGALLPLSRLVLGHMSAQDPLGVCENRVLCGGKCAVGVGRGMSDSPMHLVNQLQRDSAPAFAKSRVNTPLQAAIACHGGVRPLCSNDHIEYSVAVYALYKEPVAYQAAPATTATSCNQLVPVPCLTDERKSRFGAAVVAPKTTVFLANGGSIEPVWQLATS